MERECELEGKNKSEFLAALFKPERSVLTLIAFRSRSF